MAKKKQIHALAPMLDALRIKQTVSFDQCGALFAELYAATGSQPQPFELSGNQWCALVNLAVARYGSSENKLRDVVADLCDTIDRNLICDLGPARLADIQAALDRARNMTPNVEVSR